MLNALFNRELKPRHKFMTLVTIVVDPVTGKIEVDNAGQSYPRFYKAAEDRSEEIELPTMPLGAMKKRRSKIETRTMQSGDALILYSDGIIECSDTTGDMYGYNRFSDSFERLMREKPRQKSSARNDARARRFQGRRSISRRCHSGNYQKTLTLKPPPAPQIPCERCRVSRPVTCHI